MKHQQLDYLYVFRGLAVIFIIVSHIFLFGVQQVEGVSLFRFLAVTQIPIFIFLSGYFTSKAPELSLLSIGKYWRSKVTRLLLPLLVLPFVFHILRAEGQLAIPIREWNGEYWFTPTLFLLFVILWSFRTIVNLIIQKLPRNQREIVEVCLLVFSVFVLEYFAEHMTLGYTLLNDQLGRVSWLYKYFIIGHLFGRFLLLRKYLFRYVTSIFALIVLGVSLYFSFNVCNTISHEGGVFSLNFAMSIASIAFLLCYFKNRPLDNKLSQSLKYLGQNSLPIYLTHYFFIPDLSFVRRFLEVPTVYGLTWELAIAFFGLCLVLLPTLLVVRVMQANPYTNFVIYGEPIPTRDLSIE